jgi:DHA2 family multidrug resistance protein
MLTRHEQFHQDRLVNNLASTGDAWQNRIDSLTNMFKSGSDAVTAHSMAIQQVARNLQRQAELMSYVDDFRYMAMACFCCVPLVWMLKRVKKAAGDVPAH